tara:strand:- start:3825 stop:4139 length:315 start_codon:yes stop_codon:yes gene_type:complete
MDVWSRVAVYVPFSERIRTFQSLRCTGCLPDTNTNVSNALLQFCSEADRVERECVDEEDVHIDLGAQESVRLLVEMGFNDDEVRLALRLTYGSLNGAMEYLLHT